MAKMTKVKDIDEKKLGANPFTIGDFKILVRKRLDYEKLSKDEDGVYLPSENEYEQEKIVKLYVSQKKLNKALDVGVDSLNALGCELFFWIAGRLIAGQDYFFLDKNAFMKDKGIASVNTYKKGLNDLIAKGIIQPNLIYKGIYWINPKFVFCGSRVNKYPENVVEYKPKGK